MKRRSFFGVALALFASVPALAQSIKLPKREPLGIKEEPHYIRYLYIEAQTFDGWNIKKDYFRIKSHRFPVGTKEQHVWEYSIPSRLLRAADYIQVVGGPVLKVRESNAKFHMLGISANYLNEAPLRDDDWLIEQGYRLAHNESYTSIG